MKSPIFIFSLPRSGSTLLQRVLMSHDEIASKAEPWLLLPFLYAKRDKGVISEYDQAVAQSAFNAFISKLPNADNDYNLQLKTFISSLYSMCCINNEIYFLDKTPRYYFIISEIEKIFPDAKYIFMFRQPHQIMGSIIETWCDNKLYNLYKFNADLISGPALLAKGFDELKSKSIAIQYEKLISNPESSLRNICKYLNLTFDKKMLTNFTNQDMNGQMGDSTGVINYNEVNTEPLEKWKSVFNTPFRKKILYKYVDSIDERTLIYQGYDKSKILTEIDDVNSTRDNILRDRFDYLFSMKLSKLSVDSYDKYLKTVHKKYLKYMQMLKLH